ncbi:Hypothetical protein A7982_06372 [Minicystis rosea]|nr:Hypothetical protein A7982_06372 [Minicystis rosea]
MPPGACALANYLTDGARGERYAADVSLRPLAGALLFALIASTPASPAHADLGDDVERLVRAWSDDGAHVERLPPLFLEHRRARVLALKPPREGDAPCITIAAIGVRTTDFSVTREDRALEGAPDPRPDDAADRRLRSAGGAVVFTACGADRARLDRIRVEMATPRATVEIVAARSSAPLRELRELLPERAAGPLSPSGDPGGPLATRPLAERLARAERRARDDGAAQVDRVSGRAPANGAGRFDLELAPGCHRLEVMADALAAPAPRPDVDAEARDTSGRLLARDRSDLPDARLDLCVGEITPVNVLFAGTRGAVPVVLVRARWVIPARISTRWGARARAGLASALLRRHAPDPPDPAIIEALGIQGVTSIPFEVQPNRCYLAALAMVRGDARSIRLSATIGDRVMRDEALDHPESAAVSFCTDREGTARLEADVRANAGLWTVAVWPMGAAAP